MGDDLSGRPLTTDDYLTIFKEGTKHLSAMAESMEICWTPNESNPRRLHNLYVRNLITCYAAKFAELSSSIVRAIEEGHYLTYALCGRSLVEHAAILRYYVLHRYSPLLRGAAVDMEKLLDVDDQHLRGGKFDWEAFITGDYIKLWNAASARSVGQAKDKNAKTRSELPNPPAARVGECIKSWASTSPGVGVVYDLFCDMVHPNIGSTFLVASVGPDGLYFAKNRGESLGKHIFDKSFPMLVMTTQKPFGDFLAMLMGTIWQEGELGT